MSREALLFLMAAGQGAGLLFLYDLLRGLRRAVLHGGIATAAEDLFYWVFAGISTFALVFAENNGIFRGYILLGILLGMILYHQTLSRPVVWLTAFVLKWVLKLLCLPVKLMQKGLQIAARPVRASAPPDKYGHFRQKSGFEKNMKKVVEKERKSG